MKTIVRIITILITINFAPSAGDYYINSQDPIFLKYTSMDLSDTLIQVDLKFNLSLSSIIGTLLYAVDSKDDQLIISLYDTPGRIKVEFYDLEAYISLKTLCDCDLCNYQWLSFHIKITNVIKIKCNQGDFIENKYKDKKWNKNYPPLDKKKSEQLVIYFINTPEHVNGFPNNNQLKGCFKEALLNNKSMEFKQFPTNLPKCNYFCSNNPCNSGKCYETFSKEIKCDCSNSFWNGKYCNSSLLHCNTSTENLVTQTFNLIKLTWNDNRNISSNDERNISNILSISYEKFTFSIKVENNKLLAVYEEKNSFSQTVKATLENMYNASTNYTLFLSFKRKSVDIKLIRNNVVTVSGEFAVPRDLNEENIKSLKLIDCDGEMDIVYKNEYTWDAVIKPPLHIIPGKSIPVKIIIPTSESSVKYVVKKSDSSWLFNSILTLEIVAICVSFIIFAVFFVKKNSRNSERESKHTKPLLDIQT